MQRKSSTPWKLPIKLLQIPVVLRKINHAIIHYRRWSPKPQKQLLFTWVHRVFRESSYYKVALDIACGEMGFYSYIKSKEYIGVDMDEARLNNGASLYPKAKYYLSCIENIDSSETNGDFVFCIQTIGVNKYFDAQQTLPSVNKLIDCTNKGGLLMFNIGGLSIPHTGVIMQALQDKFEHVEIRKYGSFNKSSIVLFSAIFAFLMDVIPTLRTITKADRAFFLCKNRM